MANKIYEFVSIWILIWLKRYERDLQNHISLVFSLRNYSNFQIRSNGLGWLFGKDKWGIKNFHMNTFLEKISINQDNSNKFSKKSHMFGPPWSKLKFRFQSDRFIFHDKREGKVFISFHTINIFQKEKCQFYHFTKMLCNLSLKIFYKFCTWKKLLLTSVQENCGFNHFHLLSNKIDQLLNRVFRTISP